MGCNTIKKKQELLRIVKNKKNEIKVDSLGKEDGRGAYICYDLKCLEQLVKSNRLSRIFKRQVDKEFYDMVRGVVIDSKK